ncbi:NADH-quinone oxidoreductase subunit C [Nitrosomonas ureae]|uniref:NADH-quinone oxidoreductase subunit C n=1 Tax=Nitrosomonas ureae TaxID=44577 RepID=A0A2T5IUS0_9PROT|nr:NADH-quinone oxidoreductase subunit C [Nitrosomonas ureae]PTQ87566.1 NADH dehydrogenase subunit C [Nitrosomonas ureae]PXX10697.1 NADH dehydrogenase subunit C [Nitrosomonas ureae]
MSTIQQETLAAILRRLLQNKLINLQMQRGELTIVVNAEDILGVSKVLRDDSALMFDTLIDLCGIDFLTYGDDLSVKYDLKDRRFAVIYHLLSIERNQRLRVRVLAENNEFPVVHSVTEVWPAANWFEREAFDLYGIVFADHPDLRRILTDYGFIGNPFRKDFPITGHVEMRYDEQQRRVIYQPVSIEPREITPLVIREDYYGDSESS